MPGISILQVIGIGVPLTATFRLNNSVESRGKCPTLLEKQGFNLTECISDAVGVYLVPRRAYVSCH